MALDLEAIAARHRDVDLCDNTPLWCSAAEACMADVPALVAEIRRLREAPRTLLEGLLHWTQTRWCAEVASRPTENIHRRMLDETWTQVRRELERRLAEMERPDCQRAEEVIK